MGHCPTNWKCQVELKHQGLCSPKRRTVGRGGRTSQAFSESSKHERLGNKRIGGRPLPQGFHPIPLGRLVATDMECEPFLEDKDELHTLDDCYPFIFTNIKGPILVKEEDMDTYIRSHEDDFIGQAEESVPIKSCRRLFELFDIDTDWLEL